MFICKVEGSATSVEAQTNCTSPAEQILENSLRDTLFKYRGGGRGYSRYEMWFTFPGILAFTCDDQISAHKKRKKNMGARKRLIQYVVKNTEEKRHWVGLLC